MTQPDDWTDADPRGLLAGTQDVSESPDRCQRCNDPVALDGAELCERCARNVTLRR